MISDEEIIKRLIELSPFSDRRYDKQRLKYIFEENCKLKIETLEDIIQGEKKHDSYELHKIIKECLIGMGEYIAYLDNKAIKNYKDMDALNHVRSILRYRLCGLYAEKNSLLKNIYKDSLVDKEFDENSLAALNDFYFAKHTKKTSLKDLLANKVILHLDRVVEIWEYEKGLHKNVVFRWEKIARSYLILYYLEKEIAYLIKSYEYIDEAKNMMSYHSIPFTNRVKAEFTYKETISQMEKEGLIQKT